MIPGFVAGSGSSCWKSFIVYASLPIPAYKAGILSISAWDGVDCPEDEWTLERVVGFPDPRDCIDGRDIMLLRLFRISEDLSKRTRKVGKQTTTVASPDSRIVQKRTIETSTSFLAGILSGLLLLRITHYQGPRTEDYLYG